MIYAVIITYLVIAGITMGLVRHSMDQSPADFSHFNDDKKFNASLFMGITWPIWLGLFLIISIVAFVAGIIEYLLKDD